MAAMAPAPSGCGVQDLDAMVRQFTAGLMGLGVQRAERVAVYLDKRNETVVASFGATAAGAVFVPVNPLLKPEQVAFILRDCNVRVLVTSPGMRIRPGRPGANYLVSSFIAFSRPPMVVGNMRPPMSSFITCTDWR